MSQLWLATAEVFFFPPDPHLKLSFSLHVVLVRLLGRGLPLAVFALRQWTSPSEIKKSGE